MDRVARGEEITITRSGRPVAALRPVAAPSLPLDVVLERWRALPRLDPAGLRRDLDDVLDPGL